MLIFELRFKRKDISSVFFDCFLVLTLFIHITKFKSLKIVDYFLHQIIYSISVLATYLNVYSFSLPSLFAEIWIWFFVICFISNNVYGTYSIIVFYLSEPIFNTLNRTFVGKIYKEHDEMGFFVYFVSYFKKIYLSTHVPKGNMNWLIFYCEMLVNRISTESRLIVLWKVVVSVLLSKRCLSTLSVSDQGNFNLHNLFMCGYIKFLWFF